MQKQAERSGNGALHNYPCTGGASRRSLHHATSHSLQLTQVQQVRRELVQGRAVHLVVRHRQVCALGGGWEAGVLGQGQDGGHGVAAVAQRTGSLLADNGVAPPKSRGRA